LKYLKAQRINWVDLGVGTFTLILTVYIYIVTGSYPKAHINPVSASTFPRLLSVLMSCIGWSLIYGGLKKSQLPKISIKNRKKVFLLIALLIIYALILQLLGFTLATLALLVMILVTLEINKIAYLVLVPLIATFAIQYIFQRILSVPLPTGIFSLL
jgi:putative tricarboxylic transport membrane protein